MADVYREDPYDGKFYSLETLQQAYKDLYTERQIERYWDEKMVAGPKRMDSGSGYPIGRVPAAGAGAAPAEVIARLNVARKIIDSRERNSSIPEKAEGDEPPQKEDPWLEQVRVSAVNVTKNLEFCRWFSKRVRLRQPRMARRRTGKSQTLADA